MNRKAFYAKIKESFGPLTQKQVNGFEEILAATENLPVSHRAYILATAWHETARTMQPIRERGGPEYLKKYDTGRLAKALGNTPDADGDGITFAGRGYVQITGKANYKKASKLVNLDLVNNPDLALHPSVAVKILVHGCETGMFTGRKLSDYLPGDYRGARRVVNGQDKADLIAVYAARIEGALMATGGAHKSANRVAGVGYILAAIGAAVAAFFDELREGLHTFLSFIGG